MTTTQIKGITRSYALRQEESRMATKVTNLLIDQMMNHPLSSPEYFVTLYYGKSFTGNQLDSEDYRKRWDRGEIKKNSQIYQKIDPQVIWRFSASLVHY